MSKLNLENPTRKKLRLARNLIVLCVLGIGIYLFIHWWNSDANEPRFEIENTPIKIERIRALAELATISYKDEVVVDTVEFYKNSQEIIEGSLQKIFDVDQFKHGIKPSLVKRRLTLIVKGEVKVGFDLKDNNFKIEQNDSLITVKLPKPQINDIISSASSTKVFQENGDWSDREITALKVTARKKMRRNALDLQLDEKAKSTVMTLFEKLLKTNKKVTFVFV